MKPPVDVLIMARELNLGGVERDVAKIAMRLDRKRFNPHVATYYARGLRYDELKAAGMPILHLPLPSLVSMEAARSANKMRRYIKQHGIQVVHSYDASGVFGVPVAKALGVPVVIASQLSYRGILDRPTQVLLKMTDRWADAVLVNCEAIRKYMIEDEKVPAERVELCYNGVVTTEFYPDSSEAQPPELPQEFKDASLVIGTVCVLRPEKALSLFQEAFAKVRQLKAGMKLVFVGSGAELESLQANAVRLGITDAMVFIPATKDVATWMRRMDIFVLPSYSEAFSNSLLEAMACGCAVIGSRVGGTPELIGSHEERGFLFNSGDADDLAAKLSRYIADAELRKSNGVKAAEFVRKNLTIEIAAEKTAAMYEKWLAKRGR